MRLASETSETVRQEAWPLAASGDKAYSSPAIRGFLADRSVAAVIPWRLDERRHDPQGTAGFDKQTYRRRNLIERCVGWLKECRAVATRYEKLALNYLTAVKLAMIQRYLRLLDSSDRA
jgi:transposase